MCNQLNAVLNYNHVYRHSMSRRMDATLVHRTIIQRLLTQHHRCNGETLLLQVIDSYFQV